MTPLPAPHAEPALETYELIQRINYVLDSEIRQELRAYGLTVPQFAILCNATPEGVPLNEISARMMCDNSNLTGIVDRLETEGLVQRITAPYDRRVRLISLTAKGAEKLSDIGPSHVSSIKQRIGSLSQDKVQQLRILLHELYSSIC